MSTTPVNPQAPLGGQSHPPAESDRWKTLLDAMLPQRPIELAKQSDMVRLTRSHEPDEGGKGTTIWTKTYQKSQRGEAGRISHVATFLEPGVHEHDRRPRYHGRRRRIRCQGRDP